MLSYAPSWSSGKRVLITDVDKNLDYRQKVSAQGDVDTSHGQKTEYQAECCPEDVAYHNHSQGGGDADHGQYPESNLKSHQFSSVIFSSSRVCFGSWAAISGYM